MRLDRINLQPYQFAQFRDPHTPGLKREKWSPGQGAQLVEVSC